MIPCTSSTVNWGFEYSTEALRKKCPLSNVASVLCPFLKWKTRTFLPPPGLKEANSFSKDSMHAQEFFRKSSVIVRANSDITINLSPKIQPYINRFQTLEAHGTSLPLENFQRNPVSSKN